jgi:hypothetical protein
MRSAALLVLLALPVACISDSDVTGALDSYCVTGTHSCETDADCCVDFTCLDTICHKISPGECLPIDAGTRPTGYSCGCNLDCTSRTCSDSVCR